MPGSLDSFRTPNTNKSMGIEIECLFDRSLNVPIYQHVGFFYFIDDGSLRTSWDTVSREMVSQPLSAPWLKSEIRKLGRKYKWSENSSCGVHIHVSRKWLSEARAKKIFKFLQGLTEIDMQDLFGRRPNGYCTLDRVSGYRDRYCAINTTNEKTIEFRMFSSGGPDWCCYCVDMVKYLIDNANTLNLSAICAFRDQYKFKD